MKKYFIWIIIIGIILITFAILAFSFTPYKMDSSDFQPLTKNMSSSADFLTRNFISNPKLIAHELELYNETEIDDYPISDLPSEELKSVFTILDSGNLSKIFLNMPVSGIHEIQNKISDKEFNKILNRLPNETSIIIKKAMDYNSSR